MRILGAHGAIVLERNFWEATAATLYVRDQPPQTQQAPLRINGVEGEIEEMMRCVRAGLRKSPRMPHNETLALVRWMDAIRTQVGWAARRVAALISSMRNPMWLTSMVANLANASLSASCCHNRRCQPRHPCPVGRVEPAVLDKG